MEETSPRRRLRLAKKRVTIEAQGTMDYPVELPYYMQEPVRAW